jgi:glucokinase
MKAALAVDIGGTKIAAGVVGADGRILAHQLGKTAEARSAEKLYQDVVGLLEEARRESGLQPESIEAIGVGCGGPMQFPEGLVSPLNIPVWRDFPLRARLESDFGLPAYVDNDAKTFALGEAWLGAGRGAHCVLAMVVSTGVGGGVVSNGKLFDGAHGNAGHIGHIVVFPNGPLCACGARGCLEAIASGLSLAREAKLSLERGASSQLPPEPTAREIAAAASQGDQLALSLFRRAGVALGRGIASAATLFDLDRVVIGGGVSEAAEFFFPSLRREFEARARLSFTRNLEIKVSAGTVNAALAGAARLVLPTISAPGIGGDL